MGPQSGEKQEQLRGRGGEGVQSPGSLLEEMSGLEVSSGFALSWEPVWQWRPHLWDESKLGFVQQHLQPLWPQHMQWAGLRLHWSWALGWSLPEGWRLYHILYPTESWGGEQDGGFQSLSTPPLPTLSAEHLDLNWPRLRRIHMLHGKALGDLSHMLLIAIWTGPAPRELIYTHQYWQVLTNTANDTYLLNLYILFQGFILQINLHKCEMINTWLFLAALFVIGNN